MQLILAISVVLSFRPTSLASGFLDNCTIDRDMQIDNVSVIDALEAFYKDLVFLRASTETKQDRRYVNLFSEMNKVASDNNDDEAETASAHQLFLGVMLLLDEDKPREAKTLLYENRLEERYSSGWPMTYFKFLQAEVDRVLGNNKEAASAILVAFLERQNTAGVSLNELEKLDGLIALQKVSRFNQDVDKLYGLSKSPDYKLLVLVHLMSKDELVPLIHLRSEVYERLFKTSPSIAESLIDVGNSSSAGDMYRLHPTLDDFTGQSVPEASVEGILCEFAQKLSILMAGSQDETPSGYQFVIDQLRLLDPLFADKLDSAVVANIEADIGLAFNNAYRIWKNLLSCGKFDQTQELFISYFRTELERRTLVNCGVGALDNLQDDIEITKEIRETHPGVSLDKILQLQAKIVFLWLNCFHRRVQAIYRLAGDEDEQRLKVKQALFGTCAKIPSALGESDH